MSSRVELPAELPQAFSVAQALAAGVAPGRLRTRTLSRPFHGVRARGAVSAGALLERCRAFAPRLRDGQFFSHETALALVGAPLPEWPYAPGIHVSAYRPAREPRTRGVVGHRLQLRAPAFVWIDGLPVEDPVRAWRQAGTRWSFGDLVAAADFLLQERGVEASELRHEARMMGDMRGGSLSHALTAARGGVRSARETRLRLLLVNAGLPEPETGWELFTTRGTFVAELDLAFPRYRVAVEYDGRVHAEDAAQFARDADRWSAIRVQGWDHVRVLSHHMMGDEQAAVALVRDALRRAGWTAGR